MTQKKTECIAVKKNNPQADANPTTPRKSRFRRSMGPRLPVIGLAIYTVIFSPGIYSLLGGLARVPRKAPRNGPAQNIGWLALSSGFGQPV
jgi:hypothetical protein